MDDVLKKIQEQLQKAVDKALGKSFLDSLGKEISTGMRTRTRLGKGVESEGKKLDKLKELSPKYKKQRAKDKAKGKLFPMTTPKKSNLTRTGQLLNSLTSSTNGNTITISFKENRDDSKQNIKIVGYQEDQNRPFFYISKPEKANILRTIRERILNEVKKIT